MQGLVALSGYHSPLCDELYGVWPRVDRVAMAEGAKERIETLWLNSACSMALASARAQQSLMRETA